MPTEGLLESFRGQMVALLVWAVLAVVLALALTLGLALLRAAGTVLFGSSDGSMRRPLIAVWLVCVAPPLAIATIKSAVHFVTWLNAAIAPYWWVGVILLAGGLTVAAAITISRHYRQHRPPAAELSTPGPVAPEPFTAISTTPTMGWSLPANTEHWDQRRSA